MVSDPSRCDSKFTRILYYAKSSLFFQSTIMRRPATWWHQNPRRVRPFVKLLMMKPSNKKGHVRQKFQLVTTAAERSFWPTLLLLRRRRRGRFGQLYYSYGGGGECMAKVVCSFDLLSWEGQQLDDVCLSGCWWQSQAIYIYMIKYKTHETEISARCDDERQDVRDGKSTRRRTQDGNPPLVELMLRSCRFNHMSNYCWGILCHDESCYNYTYVGDIFTHVHVAVLFFDRKRCHI